MFTPRILALAATLLTALTIAGTTAGTAIAASSQGHSSTVPAAGPSQSGTIQLDARFCIRGLTCVAAKASSFQAFRH